MPEVLLDSTAYIDLERANKHRREDWAVTSLRNALHYRSIYGNPSLSLISVVEILTGLYRDINPQKSKTFIEEVGKDFKLLDFDTPTAFLAGEITARLEVHRKVIEMADSLIAAVAITRGLILVTSNTRHFQRIVELGFTLEIQNWRNPLT